MSNDYGTGSRERIAWTLAGPQDDISLTDLTVLPHGSNPTGPGAQIQRQQSSNVSPDLLVVDNVATDANFPFSFQGAFQFGAHDGPLQQAFGNLWSPAVEIAGNDIAADAAENKLTSPTIGAFDALAADLPCIVHIRRDGPTPLDHFALALHVTSDPAELYLADAFDHGLDLATLAAGDNVTVKHGGVLHLGTECLYAILERQRLDVGHYFAGTGMFCTGVQAALAKGSEPTLTFNFEGNGAPAATATFGTGNVIPPPSAPIMRPDISSFKEIRLGGANDPNLVFTTWNWNLAAAAIAFGGVATRIGPLSHGADTRTWTGSFGLLDDAADSAFSFHQQAQTPDFETSVSWRHEILEPTPAGALRHGYSFYLPRIQISSSEPGGGGTGNAADFTVNWSAAKDPLLGIKGVLTRFANL